MKVITLLVTLVILQFLVLNSVLAETISTKTTTGTNTVVYTPKPLLPTQTPYAKVLYDVTEPPVKVYLQTEYPVTVKKDSGNLVVTTETGDKELKKSPDEIVVQAKKDGMDIVVDVKLKNDNNSLDYVVTGAKIEKFLALIQVTLDTKLVYDTDTGKLVNKTQTNWAKVVDLLSW